MAKATDVLAWHFVGETLRDGSPVPADGVRLVYPDEIQLCLRGFHASRKVLDALNYAPGNIICRVKITGTIEEGADKLVGSERTILWRVDGEDILRKFARECALSVINNWSAPAPVKKYLTTGNEKLRFVAWFAAWSAAEYATRSAAKYAAWSAAEAAAECSAEAAARSAAEYAARSAVTEPAARNAQEGALIKLLKHVVLGYDASA